ncbi:MAG: long-chain fatty acid--CoA ligase [Armatimonadota bacterium]|nr:long-chain fatty acid--CoA ligase [Armatimonadota bacterium]
MSQSFDTINTRFAEAARKYPDRQALSSKPSGSKTWETLTYQNVSERVREVALGLRALGIERGDRVAILSENRPEWAVLDLATLAAGAVSVPVYPTLPASQVAHILSDSGAKAIIAENAKQTAKVVQARESAPSLSIVITLDEAAAKDGILSLASVIQAGADASFEESYEARRDSVQPDDLMSLVYTSGTTGNPKGAMLTHGNMAAALDAANHQFPQFQPPSDVFLSFLPLSHVFERVTYTLAITQGAHTRFNDSIFKLMDNLAELAPTVMQCVPRVHESIHDRVADGIAKLPARRKALTEWALAVGDSVSRRRNAGKPVSPLQMFRFLAADKLVLSKIRARFGGHLKFFVSGGAALNPKTAHFFLAIGIPILEGWGLTETTAAATANQAGRVKVGTVGPRMFNVQIKTAPDGELLVKGPTVMRGYWNHPEATAEVIDADGWFHSGDIGEIDSQGYVKITDRKKDILVLANGKKVAPQPIETALKHSPLLTEVVLLGDNAGAVGALVVPNFDALKTWAKEQGLDLKTNEALIADTAARKFVKAEIDSLSKNLADFEKIKRIALIDHAFSQEGGELTPTLKVKRKVVAEKYGALLEKE